MAKIMVIGFDPFGDRPVNSSQVAVEALPGTYGSHTVVKIIVPTEWEGWEPVVEAAIAQHSPDAIAAFGEDGRIGHISVEALGTAVQTGRDNAGVNRNTVEGLDAPAWGVPSISPDTTASMAVGAPLNVRVSINAGDFICNRMLYRLGQMTDLPWSFCHVPAVTTDTDGQVARSVAAVVRGVIRHTIEDVDDPTWESFITPPAPEPEVPGEVEDYIDADIQLPGAFMPSPTNEVSYPTGIPSSWYGPEAYVVAPLSLGEGGFLLGVPRARDFAPAQGGAWGVFVKGLEPPVKNSAGRWSMWWPMGPTPPLRVDVVPVSDIHAPITQVGPPTLLDNTQFYDPYTVQLRLRLDPAGDYRPPHYVIVRAWHATTLRPLLFVFRWEMSTNGDIMSISSPTVDEIKSAGIDAAYPPIPRPDA